MKHEPSYEERVAKIRNTPIPFDQIHWGGIICVLDTTPVRPVSRWRRAWWRVLWVIEDFGYGLFGRRG